MCLIFWETANLIAKGVSVLYNLISHTEGAFFIFASLPVLDHIYPLMAAMLLDVKFYLILALICISLMVSDYIHSLKKCLLEYLIYF